MLKKHIEKKSSESSKLGVNWQSPYSSPDEGDA